MQIVYQAQRNTDLTEGRGHNVEIATFATEDAAKQAAHGWGVMGYGDGDVVPITVYDSFEEYANKDKESVRQTALAKLTRNERRALGLE